MKRFKFYLGLLALSLTLFTLGFTNIADKDYWFEYISGHFDEYILKYPQQKVYLQLDRDEYETGSTIWYKAYVLDDTKKLPDNRTKILYVELISPTKKVILNRLLKIENGSARGDFPVQDTIGTGLYLVRAYTNSMRSAGKDYLFSREIRIVNAQKLYYNRDFKRLAKKFNRKDDDIDFQFFPEGGNLVDGLKTKLAFKAIDIDGLGLDCSGKIYNRKNNLIAEFKTSHLGMGAIEFTPVAGEKYYARIETMDHKNKKVDLPEILEKGYVMNISEDTESFRVLVQTNKETGSDPVAKTVYLFIQNGGKIYYKEQIQMNDNKLNLEIEKSYFPSGVMHFTLFDGHGIPQCERLAFLDKNDAMRITTSFDKKNVGKREKVEFDVRVTNYEGKPVFADLSISVKNKTLLTGEYPGSLNIINYFLLKSDLKGNIENPGYYFSGHPEVKSNLEVLLLTQGWRKFNWKDILRDSIPYSPYPFEKDINITGRITKYYLDISVEDASVTLTLLNKYNDVFTTKSGKKGQFGFYGMNYNDTMDVLIEAKRQNLRKNIMILLDEALPLDVDFHAFKSFYQDSLMMKRKAVYEKYKEPEPDPNKPVDFKLYSRPDQVVKFDDRNFSAYPNVMEALKGRVPGLQVGNNGSVIRGPSSFYGSNDPLYLIDGIETDFYGINAININDIEYVDILKGPSAAIYGMRGANGVIAVYTKKGFFMKRGEIRFKMLGFHTPKEFYSPKYETKTITSGYNDFRKTVYWKSDIKTDRDGKARISFFQSDIEDDFEIVIEGMSRNGQVGSYNYSYTVE
ncbi:MAG: TonB-dependent receptor plug domain-containing protein [Bacteroidales bacterium]